MKRVIYMLILAVLVAFAALPRPASALDCADPVTRLDRMQTVVHARVIDVPAQHWANLAVERYHKGSGPARLYVEYRGAMTDSYDWALTPVVGFDGLIEIKQDERGYYVGPCDLHMVYSPALTGPGSVIEKLGPGQPPEPGAAELPAPVRAGLVWRWVWVGFGALAVAGFAGWWLYFRKRRAA